MKTLAARFSFTDLGKMVSLGILVLLLALGGMELSRVVAAKMLRDAAQAEASAWAASLVDSADDDIPAIIDSLVPSEKTKDLLKQASEVGGIYRYKVWNRSGDLCFVSDQQNPPRVATTIAQQQGPRVADSILSGAKFTETGFGKPPENPSYFAESYVPIKRNGMVVGVFEVYLDLNAKQALYQRSFFLTESICALAILLAGGIPGYMVYRKMLAHRAAQAEALFLADHDILTGIPNRRALGETAKNALAWNSRNKSYVAALLIDLDRFKDINDVFGHGAGDELLRLFALRLKSTIRAEDTVARLAGDEFVILQVGMAQPVGASALATRLMKVLAEPYDIGGTQITCGASIGVAIAPTDAQEWDPLLSRADTALYKAKDEGRNTICFFEAGMDATFHERRRIEIDLRRALETNAFQLAYQPLFSFHDGSLLGFEALLRWPEGWDPLSPAAFIPIAEECGLIVPIGAWVLETACKTAATWTKNLKVAVNLSSVQFRHGNIVQLIERVLSTSGLDAGRLEVEVTEGLLLEDTDAVLDQLSLLRAMGVSIVMDDFGTGYSSLSYLWKFPFDKVKIDRSFVMQMGLDSKAAAIVNTIVALGRILGLTITAEGVETSAQARALHDAGCHQAQGFLYSRPLSVTSAEALVDAARLGATETLDCPMISEV